MGSTPKYGIYFDDPEQIAKGRLQDELQALSVESALSRLDSLFSDAISDVSGRIESINSLVAESGIQAAPVDVRVYDAIRDVGCVPDAYLRTEVKGNFVRVPDGASQVAFGTDNTDKINSFIRMLGEKGGGTIFFPAGKYLVSGIILEPNITIEGEGEATVFILKDGSNRSVISNRLADSRRPNALHVRIRNITIHGNRWGQSQSWDSKKPYDLTSPHIGQSHGILLARLQTEATIDEELDAHSIIENVTVGYTQASGIQVHQHGGENRIINCHVFRAGGYGIVPAQDSFTWGCTAAETEFDGILVSRGSSIVGLCKVFRAGCIVGRGVYGGNAYPSRAQVAGFAVINSGHAVISGCNAQNNTGPGFRVHNASGSVFSGCLTDSNNMLATDDDGKWYFVANDYQSLAAQERAVGQNNPDYLVKPWTADGIKISGKCYRNIIQIVSWASTPQRGTKVGYNRHALSISGDCKENHITITSSTAWEEKERVHGEIINPHTSDMRVARQNFISDGLGRAYGYIPDSSPVVTVAEREAYQMMGQKIIDADSGALLWYDGSRGRWRKAADGSNA